MNNKSFWQYTGLSVIGTGHLKSNKPCQDSHDLKVINRWIILAVADGAGSAEHSDSGSKIAIEQSMKTLESELVNIGDNDTCESFLKNSLLKSASNAHKALLEYSDNNKIELKSLATTLLLTIANDSYIAGCQIGDGLIVYSQDFDGLPLLLIKPMHGEYINQTEFITDKKYMEKIQVVVKSLSVACISLSSDGLENLAYIYKTKEAHPPFFKPLFNFVYKTDNSDKRIAQLKGFLESDQVCCKTDDDKTLLIAIRKKDEI